VILAVPVAPPETVAALRTDADDVIAVETPEPFFAIGGWYADFSPTSDTEVVELLRAARLDEDERDDAAPRGTGVAKEIEVPAERASLPGRLNVPPGATGLVVFAHGSGSGRHSPRNQAVARALNDAGLGTLLFDLLTPAEEADRANVFDIPLLAGRLGAATTWSSGDEDARGLPIGLFGASTGAGAALCAAAEPGSPVRAVVSRGGRPDLARGRLEAVRAPTLLVVGGRDEAVLEMNREAAGHLTVEHRIEVVPGATHLFEEPGALEAVADLATRWFLDHLRVRG
jgi:putative phosphoribosyl transferase